MNNDEYKAYINKHTENGEVLFWELSNIETQIAELEKLKRKLKHKFGSDNKILKEGDRIELTWPNGVTEVIDICTPHAVEAKYEIDEFDLVYGYRSPNKDGSKSKIGQFRKLWQSQLFKNGYIKL
jgi:hypothetical protein